MAESDALRLTLLPPFGCLNYTQCSFRPHKNVWRLLPPWPIDNRGVGSDPIGAPTFCRENVFVREILRARFREPGVESIWSAEG